jgi:hypothetical protein
MTYTKGTGAVSAKYAMGGACLHDTRSKFMKTPNQFTSRKEATKNPEVEQDYGKTGKGGTLSKTEGESKKQPVIKPRT